MALAVIFAMLASYLLSRTLVPTMMLYLLKGEAAELAKGHSGKPTGFFSRCMPGSSPCSKASARCIEAS